MSAFMVIWIVSAPILILFGKFTVNDMPFKEWWDKHYGK
jgi:hypothetical protein